MKEKEVEEEEEEEGTQLTFTAQNPKRTYPSLYLREGTILHPIDIFPEQSVC